MFMKISSKLLLSFGFINLLILLSSTLVYYRLTQINQAQHTLLEQALPAALPAFVPARVTPKRPVEPAVIIELPLGEQSITVKWPASDPEGCARFVRGLAQ